ncbi:MAG: hypothetical protein KGJ62_00480 [Armatimonadetes bacterium]|nr:hypothetical protein [Armatimonadota bacterium]MDE2205180.1 hypothetical protein [Armatimonadota bacterium]
MQSFKVSAAKWVLGSALALGVSAIGAGAQTAAPHYQPLTAQMLQNAGISVPYSILPWMQEFDGPRKYPYATINWNAYVRAEQHKALMPKTRPQDLVPPVPVRGAVSSLAAGTPRFDGVGAPTGGGAAPKWTYIGPNNYMPAGLFGSGPYAMAGRVNAVAFDPVNPSIFYLGSAQGGVWKSTNAGQSWTPSTNPVMGGTSISSLAIDPTNDQVIYAGTGDYDATFQLGSGLMKSTDGGATWKRIDLQGGLPLFGDACIKALIIDPNDHNHIIVGTGRDQVLLDFLIRGFTPNWNPDGFIYSSHDGGATWTQDANFPGWVDRIVAGKTASGATDFYAAVDYMGIFKSMNGDSWQQLGSINAGLPNNPNPFVTFRMDVATSQVHPDTLYVLSEDDEKIYKSTDGGATFADTTNGFPGTFGLDTAGSFGQAFYDFFIGTSSATVLDPTTNKYVVDDAIYVGLFDVFQSVDNGSSWSTITFTYTGNDLIHTDQHAIAVDPRSPNDVLVGNDGGVYRLAYSPVSQAFKWSGLNTNLGIGQVFGAAYNPYKTTDVVSGEQDNGQPWADGDLSNWQELIGGDGSMAAICPTFPQTQYCSIIYADIFQDDFDWQQSPIDIGPGSGYAEWQTPMTISQPDTFQLFMADTVVHKYQHQPFGPIHQTDSPYPTAGTWTAEGSPKTLALSTPGFTFPDVCYSVAVSQTNPNILAAGTMYGGLWLSSDNGGTFTEIDNQGGPGGLPARSVVGIVFSPRVNYRMYVALGGTGTGHVYECQNITEVPQQWVDISGTGAGRLPDNPATSLVMVPRDDEQGFYVSDDLGVYYTNNGGASWSDTGSLGNLPQVMITQLTLDVSTGNLEATTYGRGIWRLQNAGNNVPFALYPVIPMYRGSLSALQTTVQLYPYNQPVLEDPRLLNAFQLDTAPTEQRTQALTPAGWFTTSLTSDETSDVYITIPKCLRRRVTRANIPAHQLISTSMILGDVNPVKDPTTLQIVRYGDNVIDAKDVVAVLLRMGQWYSGPEDVDGDGRVTSRDLAIVESNLGKAGD